MRQDKLGAVTSPTPEAGIRFTRVPSKTNPANEVDAYLETVPEPARSALQKVRAQIRGAAPKEATEAISYGMPTFQYHGGLMGYAAFPKHCSLFPMNGTLVAEFQEDLKAYKTSKGAIQFAPEKPLPAALVKKLVKVRVAQNELKKKAK